MSKEMLEFSFATANNAISSHDPSEITGIIERNFALKQGKSVFHCIMGLEATFAGSQWSSSDCFVRMAIGHCEIIIYKEKKTKDVFDYF